MSSDKPSLVNKLAERFGVADGNKLLDALKQTAFSNGDREPTNAQMMALLVVADQHGLNPWTREIYAFPDKKGGIVPVVGVDGWSRIANEHPEFNGVEFTQSENNVLMDDNTKPCPEYMECTVYRRDREYPIKVREYLDEVYKPAVQKQGNRGPYLITGPWQTHPKRFLRHKTMIQAFRLAFGFAGIYDPDEAVRIREQQEKDMGIVEVVESSPSTQTPKSLPEQHVPAIEYQQQPDLMGQITGNQLQEQVVQQTVEQQSPVTTENQAVQVQEGMSQVIEHPSQFTPNQQLFEITTNLIGRARDSGAWDTCFDYARQQWRGDEQAYVMSELTKAHQAACQTH